MTKRMSKSRRRTSVRPETSSSHANFIIESGDDSLQHESTVTAAMKVARHLGKHDRPAVVWKHVARGKYRPYRVVVEGRVFK